MKRLIIALLLLALGFVLIFCGTGELIIAGNERVYSDSDIVPTYTSSFEN